MKYLFRLYLTLLLFISLSACAKTQEILTHSDPAATDRDEDINVVEATTWKLAIISDMNGSYGSTTYSSSVKEAIKYIAGDNVSAVISTGDMVAGQKSGLDYQKMWDSFHSVVTNPLDSARLPLLPSPGNHDGSAGSGFQNERNIYVRNWNNYPISRFNSFRPHNSQITFVPGVIQNYPLNYAISMGPAVLIGLDATAVGPLINNQLTWLEDVLSKTSQAKIKIVFGHVPLYPFAFDKATEYLAYGQAKTGYAERFESLLETHNVTYYLSGHDHAFFPGHRNSSVRYISTPLLGSGARAVLTADRSSPISKTGFLYLSFDSEGNHQLEALESPSFQTMSYQALPAAVSIPKTDAEDCKSCGSFPLEFFLNTTKRELFYRLEP